MICTFRNCGHREVSAEWQPRCTERCERWGVFGGQHSNPEGAGCGALPDGLAAHAAVAEGRLVLAAVVAALPDPGLALEPAAGGMALELAAGGELGELHESGGTWGASPPICCS